MSTQPPAAEPLPAALPPPKPRRRWWVSLLLVLVIFGSGLTIGVVGTLVFVRNELWTAIHRPYLVPERIAKRLKGKLGLSDQQEAQVLVILQERQREFQKIRRRVQPEVEAQLDIVERDIAAVLDPKQRETWQQSFERMRALWVPPLPAATEEDAGRAKKDG